MVTLQLTLWNMECTRMSQPQLRDYMPEDQCILSSEHWVNCCHSTLQLYTYTQAYLLASIIQVKPYHPTYYKYRVVEIKTFIVNFTIWSDEVQNPKVLSYRALLGQDLHLLSHCALPIILSRTWSSLQRHCQSQHSCWKRRTSLNSCLCRTTRQKVCTFLFTNGL